MPPLEDVLRLVELRGEVDEGTKYRPTLEALRAYHLAASKLSEFILEQGVEDWLDELVAEMAAGEGKR